MQNIGSATKQEAMSILSGILMECGHHFGSGVMPGFGSAEGPATNDFLFGPSSLLDTSAMLRNIVSGHAVALQPWDEETNPATSTRDLLDYMRVSVPALIAYYHEVRSGALEGTGKKHFELENLMPLWPLLGRCVDKEQSSTSMAIAMHVFALSVVRVNGEKRCKRLQIGLGAALARQLQQIERAEPTYNAAMPASINMDGKEIFLVYGLKRWIRKTMHGETGAPPPVLASEEDVARRQLARNPWLAGQQLLVATLAGGTGLAPYLFNCQGQVRDVLHLYNAMRCAEVIAPLPLLDLLHENLRNAKVVWFAGVPKKAFAKQWVHAQGIGTNMKTRRPSSNLTPPDMSLAYRRAAEADFAGGQLAYCCITISIYICTYNYHKRYRY